MLITAAEMGGRARCDLRIRTGRIVEIAAGLRPRDGEPVLDAAGAALLPGLHDHHIHLFALAAAYSSLPCGPPEVSSEDELARAFAAHTGAGEWIRGVGYHESVAGELDRDLLDRLSPQRPVRVQHRSGAMWAVNSAGAAILGIDEGPVPPGVERVSGGRASGRLFRCDRWLREKLETESPPRLDAVGRRLAACGVTGVTDATAGNGAAELRCFEAALRNGDLPQSLLLMGNCELPLPEHPRIVRGPLKLMLDERELAGPDDLAQQIAAAHLQSRAVAVHCVTRVELIVALSALSAAGVAPGDRIEHASVAPPDALELLAATGVTVVTQPGFVHERGDDYLRDVEARDQPWLYRGRAFLEAGIPLAAGTDAPFASPDPWAAMRAAVSRTTATGAALGAGEALSPERALALFTSDPQTPGAAPRALAVGQAADLCLLDRPWAIAREELTAKMVRATVAGGALVWQRDGGGEKH